MKAQITTLLLLTSLCLSAAYAETPRQEDSIKQNQSPPQLVVMNNKRLDELIKRIDKQPEGQLGRWVMRYESIQLYVVTDEKADRMRIITAIAPAKDLEPELLYRLMQSNFDSALDARYAIAKDVLWSAFIHPLASLTDKDFFSGLAQTIMLVATYGSTYTSGALTFGGGDSQTEQQRYYEDIIKKGAI